MIPPVAESVLVVMETPVNDVMDIVPPPGAAATHVFDVVETLVTAASEPETPPTPATV